jgi:hypothetical protein
MPLSSCTALAAPQGKGGCTREEGDVGAPPAAAPPRLPQATMQDSWWRRGGRRPPGILRRRRTGAPPETNRFSADGNPTPCTSVVVPGGLPRAIPCLSNTKIHTKGNK